MTLAELKNGDKFQFYDWDDIVLYGPYEYIKVKPFVHLDRVDIVSESRFGLYFTACRSGSPVILAK